MEGNVEDETQSMMQKAWNTRENFGRVFLPLL
jgi:hypothetical protein